MSYGYGGALAASGTLLFKRTALLSQDMMVRAHAMCLILYGCRLCTFLLYRELSIPRFREFRDKIERAASERGGRMKRLPFILLCSLLYLGLAAPAMLTLRAVQMGSTLAGESRWRAVFGGCLTLMYIGWALAAGGDAYKSIGKLLRGNDALITGGPFALLRHPNYTGEQLLWTANFAAGVIATLSLWPTLQTMAWRSIAQTVGWLSASAIGVMGIILVLMQATRGLEKRQAHKHGNDAAYACWVARTWGGFALPAKEGSGPESGAAGSKANTVASPPG